MRFTSLLLEKLPYFPDHKMHQDFKSKFRGKHFVHLTLLSQILAESSIDHTVPINLLSAVTCIIIFLTQIVQFRTLLIPHFLNKLLSVNLVHLYCLQIIRVYNDCRTRYKSCKKHCTIALLS
jgi:hypothetical protein